MTRRKGIGKMTEADTNQVTENCKAEGAEDLEKWRELSLNDESSVRGLHGCLPVHPIYGKGWFLRIKTVYFYGTLEYFSTFPISILKEAFQEAFRVLLSYLRSTLFRR